MEASPMTSYLVLYRSPTSPEEQMASATPEQAQAGMEAWTAWAGNAGEAIVDLGAPVGAGGSVGAAADTGAGFLGGFSILQADSTAALEQLLESQPHLMVEGNSIEYYEFLAVPGMD
jgi:hypothetical protein